MGANSPDHLVRAAMEGVTLGLRYGLDRLRQLGTAQTTICLAGGGAQNPVRLQLCADVLGIPVVRSAVVEVLSPVVQ
jgi:sugar (pentulose or hexulose) kinase